MKLHLHVKTLYFDQIKAGTKAEEYRLHTGYWVKRLVELPSGTKRAFDGIVIYNAYKSGAENRIEFPWRGFTLKRITHPHFGPDEVTVFAIKLAAWKAKHGVINNADGEIDEEAMMVAEDAKRKGKDYCGHCAEQFLISAMRLVTRRDDPYIQFDEDEPSNKPDWYIQVQHRIRMCLPCFKEEYEQEDGESENNQIQGRPTPDSAQPKL